MKKSIDPFDCKIGDKVIFTGTTMFWFTDIIANGKKLKKGAKYTIKSKQIASSWTGITLEETGDLEYNLGWFRYCKPYKKSNSTKESEFIENNKGILDSIP